MNYFCLIFAEYGKSQTVIPHKKTEKEQSDMVGEEKGHLFKDNKSSSIGSKTDSMSISKSNLATVILLAKILSFLMCLLDLIHRF